MADAQDGLDAVRELLAIQREANDIEVRRCVCLLQNESLRRRLDELNDSLLDGDVVQMAQETAAVHDMIAENVRAASALEKQLNAIKWRLHNWDLRDVA